MLAALQNLADKSLHFLAHASNETLGACLVGLGATTYLILGRVGLVVIGLAGGVVLHATWEGTRNDDRDEATKMAELQRKREAGVEVVKRLLDWRDSKANMTKSAREELSVSPGAELGYSGFEPNTAEALEQLTNAVITDYVRYWYEPTVPGEEKFPASCRGVLTAFLLSVSGHLRRKRPADIFLDFATNATSMIIVFLNELSAALNASPNSSANDAVMTYLQMKPDSSLAHILDRKTQDKKLDSIAEDILRSYVDTKAYTCQPVHVFLREILAQLLLGHTITLCSAPAWINDWIVYGLEESETTKEVMGIVDNVVKSPPTDNVGKAETASPASGTLSAEGGQHDPPESLELHNGRISKAEDAMDEAIREAQRLTQLMIEEDRRRAQGEQRKQSFTGSSDDISDSLTSQGAPTPTSSQSDRDRQEAEVSAWSEQPVSPAEKDETPLTPTTRQPFTSFDQLPNHQLTSLADSPEKARKEQAQLTLHNAIISIFDDSLPSDKTSIKTRPTDDLLIQIEPSSSAFPGWMIARKYADFEMLHEVLRRLSVITGVNFTSAHAELPKWKLHTKASLRQELERYLMDAVRFQPLAESEGMKRFLEKDQAFVKSPTKGFGWPTPDAFGKFGGDMMNVLTKAPKDVAGGSKTLFGGVAGLVANKKDPSQASLNRSSMTASNGSMPTFHGAEGKQRGSQLGLVDSSTTRTDASRYSQESLPPGPPAVIGRPPSASGMDERGSDPLTPPLPDRSRGQAVRTRSYISQTSPTRPEIIDPLSGIQDTFDLPPPPSEMPDDYAATNLPLGRTIDTVEPSDDASMHTAESAELPVLPPRPKSGRPRTESRPKQPLTEQETSVAIELTFAMITELYTLSSAWQFRRTLLAAAKTFLLRPGNPQLAAVRDMLQKDLLDANVSDAGIAAQLRKLRENALPTAEELEIWYRDYPEKNLDQKEELRVKARKLLVTKGMPQALNSVMGAAASGEALGKVFDCLQVPEVSRGLIFGLMLQALKVVTH